MGDNGNGNGNGNGGTATIRDWFLKTAGAIVGGLGLAGSMVVIGSAILWIRFKEAGIPAIQAVSVQPRPEALVQGAQTTAFFVFAALAVVVALYIVDFPEAEANPNPGAPRPIRPATTWCLRLLPVVGLLWAIFCTDLGWLWVLGLLLVAVVLTGACLWIGRQASKNFWALAASVFVSIVVFSGVAEYAIVQSQKYVQAVAILRGKDDAGLTGYYVAATEKKLYFANSIGAEGSVKPDGKPLQEVALDEKVTYSIGPLESQEDATERAPAMLRRLVSDRERMVPATLTQASLPDWIPSEAVATFAGGIATYEEVADEPLCMMRYAEKAQKEKKRSFWTSCAEAEAQTSIHDARESLALPGRFQRNYEVRVKVEVPSGTKLRYAEGKIAPQCGGEGKRPCGHRYPGGGVQYWIEKPEELGEITLECTMSQPDEETAWEACS